MRRPDARLHPQKLDRGRDAQRPVVFVVREHGHQLVGPVLGGAPALDVAVADPTGHEAAAGDHAAEGEGYNIDQVGKLPRVLSHHRPSVPVRSGYCGPPRLRHNQVSQETGNPRGLPWPMVAPPDRENPLVTRSVGLRGGRLPNLLPFLEDFA